MSKKSKTKQKNVMYNFQFWYKQNNVKIHSDYYKYHNIL